MIWKVIANILCVVISKPNGLNTWVGLITSMYIPNLKKQNVLLIMNNIVVQPLSMLLGVTHLAFQPYSWAILQFFSYHLLLQVWNNHLDKGILISFQV